MICYVSLRHCSDRERRDTFSCEVCQVDNSDRATRRQSDCRVEQRTLFRKRERNTNYTVRIAKSAQIRTKKEVQNPVEKGCGWVGRGN